MPGSSTDEKIHKLKICIFSFSFDIVDLHEWPCIMKIWIKMIHCPCYHKYSIIVQHITDKDGFYTFSQSYFMFFPDFQYEWRPSWTPSWILKPTQLFLILRLYWYKGKTFPNILICNIAWNTFNMTYF